jgi:hypothetical protein
VWRFLSVLYASEKYGTPSGHTMPILCDLLPAIKPLFTLSQCSVQGTFTTISQPHTIFMKIASVAHIKGKVNYNLYFQHLLPDGLTSPCTTIAESKAVLSQQQQPHEAEFLLRNYQLLS